ncbi:MAG: hypothetical protein SVR08_17200 [Spirochaetota bacterium]|nr:hypothetical protein [Spirochaetota bacterium]
MKNSKDKLPIFPEGLPIVTPDVDLPVLKLSPDAITISVHHVFETDEIRTDSNIEQICRWIFNYPERNFYLFLIEGVRENRDLIYNLEQKGLLAPTSEMHYYKHPSNRPKDYIQIHPDRIEFDWEKDVIKKGPKYVRLKLSLSERKRRELEIQEKIDSEKEANSNPMSNKSLTRLEVYKQWFLNHKVLSILIFIGVIIIALGTFSDSVWKLVDSYKRVIQHSKNTEIEESSNIAQSDDLKITKVRPIIDQPTMFYESFGTGIMSLYWELVLSNNSVNDLSVIDYDVLQVSEGGPISYTNLRQGIYILDGNKLHPVNFPLVIPAGHSLALFIRVGVMMDPKAYTMVKEKFDPVQQTNASTIMDFLRSQEIDIFGNPFTKNDVGVYSLPALNEINDPIFGVTFKTGRDTKIVELISWYKYGLFRLVTE